MTKRPSENTRVTQDGERAYIEGSMLIETEDAPGGILIYYADGDEEIIHVNKHVLELFECDTVDEFLELTGGTFRGFVHDEDIDSAEDSIWGQVDKQDNLDHIYYRIETKTGKLVNIDDYGRLVEREGERPVFYVFVVEAKHTEFVDWLTGLPGMTRFHHLAAFGADAIRSRGEQPAAIALDLVGLKTFNSQYGRDAGDNLLCVFTDVLRKHFGSEATSRFSEDHFYAFAPVTNIEDRLKALFEDFKLANDGKVLPIRAGVYACDEGDDIVAEGFDRAKFACDYDRKTWYSHFVWFDDEMRRNARLQIHILDHVDEAISEGWIRPYYQAVIRTSSGYACGEEALARWIDPKYGELSPVQFVPVLEEARLLQRLDMHMVDCVLSDMKVKMANGVPVIPVSVNISLRDLGELDIVKEITNKVDAAGLDRSMLRIEFTESAASDDLEFFKEQVEALQSAGFDVWMDDFGSGYSSLNLLQEYAFDLIKLDMEFIKDVDNEKASEIISGVIRTATGLGVVTLAEGVETEEQTMFLTNAGCSMLQGYFFTRPIPLETVIERFKSGEGLIREDPGETAYWNAVGAVNLIEPTSNVDGRAVDGTPLSEFPAGVMERRGDTWKLLRSNRAYREFLERGGAISINEPSLGAIEFKRGVDLEYRDAATRSIQTGLWERISGRMEYGTGLQFYTRPVASMPDVEAFVIASVPTMLGTALGTYGDVPVAYAVLRVVLDAAGSRVIDAEYVYANSVYCNWCNYSQPDLPGTSFLSLTGAESEIWFPYFYRSAILKQEEHGVVFSDEVNHWLSFNTAPSPIEGCFVYAFTFADDERRERQEMIISRDTSELIIGITNVFNKETSYDVAMNGVLERISHAIHPKRLFIFEWDKGAMSRVFEWREEGAQSKIDVLLSIKSEQFSLWERLFRNRESVIIPDISMLQGEHEELYQWLLREEIKRLLVIPLLHNGGFIGFIVAENYVLEESLDTKRLLETVSSYISVRIAHQRLVNELELMGTHDMLTGLLNRRGIDLEVNRRTEEHPEAPFVLALMDLDDFKTLNDMHGHDVGDEALRSLSRTIAETFSGEAIIGRNGGDEFLIMLYGSAVERADELFAAFSQMDLSCDCNGKHYKLSMSIGYVSYPDQVDNLKTAYTRADVALYAVKLSGKSGFVRYTPDLESSYRSLLGFSSRDIAENIPGGIMVHKASGNREILFANDELVHMLGCDSLSDFMNFTGGAFDGLALPEDLPAVREALARQVETGNSESKGFADYRIRTKSGTVRRVSANSRLVEVDMVGKVFYVIIIDR